MRTKTFLTASFILLFIACRIPSAFAQHLVLFETFDNACEPCPATGIRGPFDNAIKSTVSNESSKIIWLNHHVVNICDPAAQSCPNSGSVGHRLSEWSGTGSEPVFYAAVDRTVFNATSVRVDPSSSGGNYSDWTGAIDQLASNPPGASITLDSATLDKSNNLNYMLTAYITITTQQAIPDSLILRCAITQNNVAFTGSSVNCTPDPAPTPQNNVVRVITIKDTGMFVIVHGGASSGLTKHVIYTQPIKGPSGDPRWKTADMTLIAFLETGGSDYHVINAAVLKQDLDLLPPPGPTLSLISSGLDNDTLHPGSIATISYTSTNLPNGVMAYYSLDNGATWRYISNATSSPINWSVPDSVTTHGKIKLIAVGDQSLTSVETGNFTIAFAPSVSFIYPVNKVLHADSSYTVQWTKFAVGGVKLQYYLDNGTGGFSTAVVIDSNITNTFYSWRTPDTNKIVELQLIPDKNEAPAASVTDTIEKLILQGVSQNAAAMGSLAITGVFPNPAARGAEMIVQYLEMQPRQVSMQLLDLLGRIAVQSQSADNQPISLDTRSLTSGTYIVRLSDGVNTVSKRVEIMR